MSKIKEYTQYRNVTVVELCNGEWGVVDVAKSRLSYHSASTIG